MSVYQCHIAPDYDLLSLQYKRAKKSGPHTHMTAEKRQFLSTLLEVSLQKMRWDSETDIDDLDDDDRTAFEQMRKASIAFDLILPRGRLGNSSPRFSGS